MEFYPEGHRIETTQNRLRTASLFALAEAAKSQDILEGKAVVCDAAHNLIVELGEGLRGIIPREEGALGIREGTTRDIAIISRVNKPVCFVVTGFETRDGAVMPVLSRRAAQQRCSDEWLCRLVPGDVIDARITHLEPFGAFADIGCGIASLLPIDAISISRISHPRDRFSVGQKIRAVVRARDPEGRIALSHKEPGWRTRPLFPPARRSPALSVRSNLTEFLSSWPRISPDLPNRRGRSNAGRRRVSTSKA